MKRKLKITNSILLFFLIVVWILSSLTFNYYYPYSHLDNPNFNVFFFIFQIIKISAMLLLPLAIFLDNKISKTISKFLFPILSLVSLAFFNMYIKMDKLDVINYPTSTIDPSFTLTQTETDIFNQINLFMPKWLIGTLFVLEAILISVCSNLLWFTDDFKKSDLKHLIFTPLFIFSTLPLSLLDTAVRYMSPHTIDTLYFRSFGVWHYIYFLFLIIITTTSFFLLKRLDKDKQDLYLRSMAIVLVIHFHSKTSMLIGDGYNTYHTIFNAVPFFVCDLGKYMVLISVFMKKDILYKICYYVHGGGALAVFFYMGNEASNDYGTIFSYSFLYFIITHTLLFLLSTLPKWLNHFEFKLKDIIIPSGYLGIVLFLSIISGAGIANYVAGFKDSLGNSLPYMFNPNYSFAMTCPINISFPTVLNIKMGVYEGNPIYQLSLFLVYEVIFILWYVFQISFVKVKDSLIAHFNRT